MKAYQIKNWDELYEVAQSRKCTTMKWVAIPNSHDGNGFLEIAEHDRATELFAAWVLIVQVASKMPKRGLLVTDSGRALTPKMLSRKTHFPSEIFELAFEILVNGEIKWLERVDV